MGISKINKEHLIKFHKYKCEICKKKFPFSELEIHRIDKELGYLDHRNLKVVCKAHHKILTSAKNMALGILK